MSYRDLAAETAKAWEKHAHAERYIETKLHTKAMAWLVDEIEKALMHVTASGTKELSSIATTAKPKGKAKVSA